MSHVSGVPISNDFFSNGEEEDDEVTAEMVVNMLHRVPDAIPRPSPIKRPRMADNRQYQTNESSHWHSLQHNESESSEYPSRKILRSSKFSSVTIPTSVNTGHAGDNDILHDPHDLAPETESLEEVGPDLDQPLYKYLRSDGLSPLSLQKLRDATSVLQSKKKHRLSPLTAYSDKELYDLMASMAEAWKNCGKLMWRKRIYKIMANARIRQAPNNTLRPNEVAKIKELENKIKAREDWEAKQKQ